MNSIPIFPIFFLALWIAIHWLLSRLSGWSGLAQRYAARDSYLGGWKGWQWANFRGIGYKGCMWIGIAPDGLHLQTGPWIIFRAFHPPLRIPWSAIKFVEPGTYWFIKTAQIELQSGEKFMLKWKSLEGAERFLADKMSSPADFSMRN